MAFFLLSRSFQSTRDAAWEKEPRQEPRVPGAAAWAGKWGLQGPVDMLQTPTQPWALGPGGHSGRRGHRCLWRW